MELTRGDSGQYNFQRINAQGEVIMSTPNTLDFTVKRSYSDRAPVFQKKIDDMQMDEEGYWHFTIEPEDTETLDIDTYVYDIEVTEDGYVQTISKGSLKLLPEATWVSNR